MSAKQLPGDQTDGKAIKAQRYVKGRILTIVAG